MSIEISPAYLLNVERGELEPAELWHTIGEQQLTDWEAEWVPELFRAMQRLRRAGVPRRFWPQSRHWDWRRKTESLQGLLAHPGFSLVCAGMTQGMMLIDMVTKRCRLESQNGKDLVYVEYLCVFRACRAGISQDAGRDFATMPVQDFTTCRSKLTRVRELCPAVA